MTKSLQRLTLFAAIAGAVLGAGTFLVFSTGFPGREKLFILWTISPLPVAWGLSLLVARTDIARKIVLAGAALALLAGLGVYGEAIYAHLGRHESLAGLVALFVPLIQYALLAPFMVAAGLASWLAGRRKSAL